jgi:hypothetical protein
MKHGTGGERSILASFPSSTRARAARDALAEAGIEEVRIDRAGRYGGENNSRLNTPMTWQADMLTGLTLSADNAEQFGNESSVLLGADPSVSGYSGPGYGMAGGMGFLLAAVTDETKLDQAVEIIRQNGGIV